MILQITRYENDSWDILQLFSVRLRELSRLLTDTSEVWRCHLPCTRSSAWHLEEQSEPEPVVCALTHTPHANGAD